MNLENEFAETHGCSVVERLSSYEIAEPKKKYVRAVTFDDNWRKRKAS